MKTPTALETVLSALSNYAPGVPNETIRALALANAGERFAASFRSETYGWCETALVAAWFALGFETVVSPGWGKPFDSDADDDASAFAVAARAAIGNERLAADVLGAIRESTDEPAFAGARPAVTRWIAITALALAAEAYAQCCEDYDDDESTY